MGILTNPNDTKADRDDVSEVIRRNGGRAEFSHIVKELNISEKRAKELVERAVGNGEHPNRVYTYKDGGRDIYQNRH